MELYTYQVAHWRRLQNRGIRLVDTTVKTGCVQLAPTWEMVLGVKRGTLSEAQYTTHYQQILEYWWFRDPLFFDDLMQTPRLAVGCYCAAGQFCHRHLLVGFLQHITPLEYRGELT